MSKIELEKALSKYPEITNELSSIFKDRENIIYNWMTTPKRPLLGKTPLETLINEPDQVMDMLERMKAGDFS